MALGWEQQFQRTTRRMGNSSGKGAINQKKAQEAFARLERGREEDKALTLLLQYASDETRTADLFLRPARVALLLELYGRGREEEKDKLEELLRRGTYWCPDAFLPPSPALFSALHKSATLLCNLLATRAWREWLASTHPEFAESIVKALEESQETKETTRGDWIRVWQVTKRTENAEKYGERVVRVLEACTKGDKGRPRLTVPVVLVLLNLAVPPEGRAAIRKSERVMAALKALGEKNYSKQKEGFVIPELVAPISVDDDSKTETEPMYQLVIYTQMVLAMVIGSESKHSRYLVATHL
jgi:hypothetical protein